MTSPYSSTLSSMRVLVTSVALVHDVCTIFRKTGDTMSAGIPKPAYDAGTSSACQFVSGPANEQPGSLNVQNAKTKLQKSPTFLLPAATAVLHIGDYILFGGRRYNVTDESEVSALDAVLEVFCQLGV